MRHYAGTSNETI